MLDSVAGHGRYSVKQRLISGLTAAVDGDDVILDAGEKKIAIRASDCRPELRSTTLWTAYGRGQPGTEIRFSREAVLPMSSEIKVSVL